MEKEIQNSSTESVGSYREWVDCIYNLLKDHAMDPKVCGYINKSDSDYKLDLEFLHINYLLKNSNLSHTEKDNLNKMMEEGRNIFAFDEEDCNRYDYDKISKRIYDVINNRIKSDPFRSETFTISDFIFSLDIMYLKRQIKYSSLPDEKKEDLSNMIDEGWNLFNYDDDDDDGNEQTDHKGFSETHCDDTQCVGTQDENDDDLFIYEDYSYKKRVREDDDDEDCGNDKKRQKEADY